MVQQSKKRSLKKVSFYYIKNPEGPGYIIDWDFVTDVYHKPEYAQKHKEILAARRTASVLFKFRDEIIYPQKYYATYIWDKKNSVLYDRKRTVKKYARPVKKYLQRGWYDLQCGIAHMAFQYGIDSTKMVVWKKGKDLIEDGGYRRTNKYPFKNPLTLKRFYFTIRLHSNLSRSGHIKKRKYLYRHLVKLEPDFLKLEPIDQERLLIKLYYTTFLKFSYEKFSVKKLDIQKNPGISTKFLQEREKTLQTFKTEAVLGKFDPL